MGTEPSEGIYEDIGAVRMDERGGPKGSGSLALGQRNEEALEEDYDDMEPVLGDSELMLDGLEPTGGREQQGTLSSEGGQLCALACVVLSLLYCCYAQGSALASAYI